jgi:hypothetical protein
MIFECQGIDALRGGGQPLCVIQIDSDDGKQWHFSSGGLQSGGIDAGRHGQSQ